MRHGPRTSWRRKRGTSHRACAGLAALAAMLGACAGPDDAPTTAELAVSSADEPGAGPRCMIPLGSWAVRYEVLDPGTSCGLLLRDEVIDFDRPDRQPAQDDARCETKLEGPDPACRFHEVRRCTRTLGGARYDSMVWRSFEVVGEQRLEGRGVASGGSSVLGLCQTTFTLRATPK